MNSSLLRALETVTHHRFWVASMVACLSAFAAQSLRLEVRPLPIALVFFCSLGIYNLDHLIDLPPERTKSARILAAISLLAVASLLTQGSLALAVLIVGGSMLSCAYFIPITIGRRKVRVETLPVVKPLVIGTAVATASLLVPLVDALGRRGSVLAQLPGYFPEIIVRAAVLSLVCGANSLLFDLRDVATDRALGVATAPTVRGLWFTRCLISALLVVAILLAELGYALGLTAALDVRRAVQAAALCILCCTWLLPARAARPLWSFLVDGILAVPLLWVLARP